MSGIRYTDEFKAGAIKKNWSGKLEYFSFKADDLYGSAALPATRKRDTDKFMATVMYTF